ncbi:MAG: hypothetical protein ACW981_04335 [Candidatus Hodarchaeales archaeon]
MKIPHDVAKKFCDEIYYKNKQKTLGIWKFQCYFCRKFAKNQYEKMCVFNHPEIAGCPQINKLYRKELKFLKKKEIEIEKIKI